MPEKVRLGPFAVRTDRAKVEAFRRSTGGNGDGVPATLPICWLAEPEIRAVVERTCRDRLPLHESQVFEYQRALEIEADYLISLSLHEQSDPPRLVLNGEVTTPAGEPCLRMETLLRLVAPALELSA